MINEMQYFFFGLLTPHTLLLDLDTKPRWTHQL